MHLGERSRRVRREGGSVAGVELQGVVERAEASTFGKQFLTKFPGCTADRAVGAMWHVLGRAAVHHGEGEISDEQHARMHVQFGTP